jgi:quercetin dioxygenase-like cupin family protein
LTLRLERNRGWFQGDTLLKTMFNIEDIKQEKIHEYPDNPEYADYFLTKDDWRLRVKVCRIRHAPHNKNRWHLETNGHSDCAIYVMSGEGEALVEKNVWTPIRTGDVFHSSPGQPHGLRVTRPGQELWYISVTSPGPVSIGDVNGRLYQIVGNGPPKGRDH